MSRLHFGSLLNSTFSTFNVFITNTLLLFCSVFFVAILFCIPIYYLWNYCFISIFNLPFIGYFKFVGIFSMIKIFTKGILL
jgi:hypothetical protein